jgi:hypothetical protein
MCITGHQELRVLLARCPCYHLLPFVGDVCFWKSVVKLFLGMVLRILIPRYYCLIFLHIFVLCGLPTAWMIIFIFILLFIHIGGRSTPVVHMFSWYLDVLLSSYSNHACNCQEISTSISHPMLFVFSIVCATWISIVCYILWWWNCLFCSSSWKLLALGGVTDYNVNCKGGGNNNPSWSWSMFLCETIWDLWRLSKVQ